MTGRPFNAKRRLGFQIRMEGFEKIYEFVELSAQNFAIMARSKSMMLMGEYLERRAKYYIQEGRKQSLTPKNSDRSYHLEDTIRFEFSEKDVLQFNAGIGVPYARIHNLPIGSFAAIVPKNPNRMLMFHWHRFGKNVAAKIVWKPGIAFLDRAIKDTQGRATEFVRAGIARAAAVDPTISGKSGAQLRGKWRGSSVYKTASQRCDIMLG